MPRIVRNIPNKRIRRIYVLIRKTIGLATYWMRSLPDFIIIGASKSGTTTLFHDLRDHPSIGTSFAKEIFFFSDNYWKGLPWYRMHFPTYFASWRSHYVKICEASPYYLFHPGTPKRMKRHLPDVRLIVMLRNPVDRTYSHYRHSVRSGCELLTFEEAINVEKERINMETEENKLKIDPKYFSFSHLMFSYLSRSEYATQLERWFRYFDRDQFLYIKSEDYFRKKTPVLQEVAKFLGIIPFAEERISNQNINPGLNYVPIKFKTREYLREYFKPHNERLYQLIGRDLEWEVDD